MEFFFHILANEFQDKIDLVDDLEEEVKSISQKNNDDLKEIIFRMEEANDHLIDEVSNIQASLNELCA